jgi:hypothetical protein
MSGRTLLAALVATTLLSSLAACGDDEDSYCGALKSDQEMFAEMQEDTSGLGLLQHRATLRSLAEEAPDDLADEWQTLLGALDAFAGTLDEVGVAPDEFVDGQPPSSLDDAERKRVADAADELSSEDVVEAANGIEQHAKDVCKLQLGL